MVQLEENRAKFEALGVKVAGMTYDDLDKLSAFHSQAGLGYPMLRDEDAKHVNALGVRNLDYEPGHRAYGVPHPGVLYIAADGTVRAKYAVPGYRQRPPFEALIEDITALLE